MSFRITKPINIQQRWFDMVKKIEINKLESLNKLKELIEQVNNKADQYLFTIDDRIVAILASPTYFERFFEKDVQDTIDEVRKKDIARQQVLEFIKDLREYNKDADPDEIQSDIDEAVRAVKKAELERLQLQTS